MITHATSGQSWVPNNPPPITGCCRTFYVYDGSDVALTIQREAGGVWSVKARYLTGGVDNVVAGRFRSVSGVRRNLALIADNQGTTLAAMKSDGGREVDASYYTRDPYGGAVGASGTGGAFNTETGFAGASTPNASGGFVYLRNRWYDPKTGRFLTQDPIGLAGGVNLYSYAGNNPVMFTDPFGLDTLQLQVVWTAPGRYHTSIRIAPEGGTAFTLGAATSSVARYVTGRSTSLVSNINRTSDRGPQNARYTLDPGPQGESAAIKRLVEQDRGYQDNLPYEGEPEPDDPNYNSNSYTSGMLKSAGIKVPKVPYNTPGYDKPVPAESFRPQ